ncbi:MAG: response regulator transcription factor [Flavobacteriales bacterium]
MTLPLNADRTQRTLMVVAVLGKDDLTDEQLNTGTFGYILQGDSPEDLMRTVEDLRSGRRPSTDARRVTVQLRPECASSKDHRLSPRELDVLRALVDGLSYKMIAAELRISFETVRSHMKCIYQKMNVNNNTAAVAKAIHEGMLFPSNAF